MKILIVSQYFYPDNFRVNDIAAALVLAGHQVKVLAGLPDYSTSRIPKEYKWFRKRRENYCGADVVRMPTIARRKGVLFRVLSYTSYACAASLYALFSDKIFDAVFVYGMSPVFQGIPAIVYRWTAGRKVVHYCLDLWPESIKIWTVHERSFIFKIIKKISSAIYRNCDVLAISSLPFRKYLVEVCGVDESKIAYLPQHSEDIYSEISGRYEENACADFLFAGNVGAGSDIQIILKAAAIVKTDKPFCIHIVGGGSELRNMEALAQSLGLDEKVVFHGRHPLEAMVDFYKMADCFLLTLRGDTFTGMTLPAKAQGYLCAGKPVLAAINGAGKDLIEQADCGEAVTAGDVDGLAGIMLRFVENPNQYKEKGLNGRRYYEENFTREIFMRNLLEILS